VIGVQLTPVQLIVAGENLGGEGVSSFDRE
jgi:hypothetical protein